MADNISLVVGGPLLRQINDKVIIVQILVMIFLCVNFSLIVTFLKKEILHTTARYILFAVTLFSDSFLLFMSDILLIFNYFEITMYVWSCIIISVLALLYNMLTPVTLTAMTLERYVAICMPLRHGELCSSRSTMRCILIIHAVSSVPSIVILSIFFASASLSSYTQYCICSAELLMFPRWQDHIRATLYQFYFIIMFITIIFCYVKIMKVAKAASGENRMSKWKGLRTVSFHGFQLLLCLIQLWCPFIETALLQISLRLFANVRYTNYILFSLAPRCLSPLIYGLRDETFSLALKNLIFFSLYKKKLRR
ncbi:odorant receptor 131-2-like [Etheostoma cragini]|uniref:odorant receptor 131-2-like n=1 Tax=Etheostoma cragini TaxID=417921 RepID=UPI00155F4F2E|nr:odorant receptor 131-2-like [Etheostoma cragini]